MQVVRSSRSEMSRVRPLPVDFKNLKLTPEEGFVLSRVDGDTSVHELVTLTGLDEGRVVTILRSLAQAGAVDVVGLVAIPDLPPAAPVLDDEEPPAETDEQAPADAELDTADEEQKLGEREYRRIYETVYHPLSKDQRIKLAGEVGSADLLALCLDAEAPIIHAIVTNPNVAFAHARMIAQHHRTSMGLEAIAKRMDFLKDSLVQRRLLRNPAIPTTILARIANPKMMIDVYKIVVDREIPERSRGLAREVLRKKFVLASSDEKAALLFKTDGRCLLHLVNCSLDAHATQILCGKSSYTMMFVQNLARWSATPPPLIAHLLRLPIVRSNVGMKKMLLKHPNASSEARRNG